MIVMTANKPKSYPFPNVKPLIHATTCLELLKFPPITRNVGKVPGNLSPALLVYSDTLLAFTLSHSPHVLFVFVFSSRSVPPFFHSCCYNSLSHFCYFWTFRSQAALPSLSLSVRFACMQVLLFWIRNVCFRYDGLVPLWTIEIRNLLAGQVIISCAL